MRCRKPRAADNELTTFQNFGRTPKTLRENEVEDRPNRRPSDDGSVHPSLSSSQKTKRSWGPSHFTAGNDLPEDELPIRRLNTRDTRDSRQDKFSEDLLYPSDQGSASSRSKMRFQSRDEPSDQKRRVYRTKYTNPDRLAEDQMGMERTHGRKFLAHDEKASSGGLRMDPTSGERGASPPGVSSPKFSAFADGREEDRAKIERAKRRNQRFALEEQSREENPRPNQRKSTRSARLNQNNDLDDFEALDVDDEFFEGSRRRRSNVKDRLDYTKSPTTPQIQLPDFISIERLAQLLKIRVDILINELEEEGFEGARSDHVLDAETSSMIADLHGFEPVFATVTGVEDLVARAPAKDKSLLPPRPPIVTIMGHVDHGKTTILDWLRKTSVAASEHGGITQHIGAFSFTMPGSKKRITFLDTPGHAAFLEMRRRGANVTDIVVLVVAADDSVKPQTIEAIKHAMDAQVPIIVAINKVDKSEANIDRVKQDLTQHQITVEDWGGDIQAVAVSGKTGQGMQELEEAILLLAEVSDFRAEVDGPVEGWIIESKVTTAGRVATVLVKRGTLRSGDIIVAGPTWARVRTLRNDAGHLVEDASPGAPVQVDGWRGDPSAGLEVLQAESEDQAKEVVDLRVEREEAIKAAVDIAAITVSRNEETEARTRMREKQAEDRENFQGTRHGKRVYTRALENEGWVESAKSAGPVKVPFVIKADVAGSVEALVGAVSAIGNHEIVPSIIHSGPGLVTESDVRHLAATGETGYIISFNQPMDPAASRLAEMLEVPVLHHNIIYKVTDDVKAKLSAALPPITTQRVVGEAEVAQIFDISLKRGKLKVAGCKVTNGIIHRTHKVRVLRGGTTIYTGKEGCAMTV